MQKKGGWITKSRKVVYKNPWIEVTEDSVIRPDGKDGIYATVDIAPGVSIVAMNKDKELFLLENYQYALGEEIITVPGGAIDKGELPEEAAKRELKEEAGISAKKWTYFGLTNALTSGIIASPNYMYLAEDISEGKQQLDGGEDMQVFKTPLVEAVDMVLNGKITHPTTALLILRTYYHFK